MLHSLEQLETSLLFSLIVGLGTPLVIYLFLKEFESIRIGVRLILSIVSLILILPLISYQSFSGIGIETIAVVDLLLIISMIILRARNL